MDRRAFLISMAAVAVPTWPRPSRPLPKPQDAAAPAEWDFTAEDFDTFQARMRQRADEVA